MLRLIPLIAFVVLAVVLYFGLGNAENKDEIPSPLINRPAPDFTLPVLGNSARQISTADLAGEPYVLNVWASWCYACRIEHPVITALAESGQVKVVGLNYKDLEADARQWLDRFGNPYHLILADVPGRVAIDFGVVAAPETFLVDATGTIRYKHIGAVSEEVLANELLPALQAIRASREN